MNLLGQMAGADLHRGARTVPNQRDDADTHREVGHVVPADDRLWTQIAHDTDRVGARVKSVARGDLGDAVPLNFEAARIPHEDSEPCVRGSDVIAKNS